MLVFKLKNFFKTHFFFRCRIKTSHIKNFSNVFKQPFFLLSKALNEYHRKKIKTKLFSEYKNKFKLIGGGKKRKKKNYTKPKKIKHVNKTIKLRLLNYYSINEGKIERLKKTSPQFPGCFMAEHFDRTTCGKTGLTIIRSD